MYRPALNAAAIIGALSVILGAFGAHKLKEILEPNLLISFETAVRYQFYHVFALFFTGIMGQYFPSKYIRYATISFITGIILFSGSIYALVALKSTSDIGLGGLGIMTPIGGVFLIVAWVFVFIAIQQRTAHLNKN